MNNINYWKERFDSLLEENRAIIKRSTFNRFVSGSINRLIISLSIFGLPRLLLKFFLWLHRLSYTMASFLASKVYGIHPKHFVGYYHKFFIENINKNSTILDVGCGTGELTIELAGITSADVIGIDNNQKNIEIAKACLSSQRNIQFMVGNATNLNLYGMRFDRIILSNVLEHINDSTTLLNSLLNLISDQGKLLIRVPRLDADWTVLTKKELGMFYRSSVDHYQEYTAQALAQELDNNGWDVVRIDEREELFGIFKPKKKGLGE